MKELSDKPGVKVYRALLTQTGTAAPVATVLENTLGGTLVWTRLAAGAYSGTLAGAFTEHKTWLVMQLANADAVGESAGPHIVSSFSRSSNDVVSIEFGAGEVGVDALGPMQLPVEIRVYP